MTPAGMATATIFFKQHREGETHEWNTKLFEKCNSSRVFSCFQKNKTILAQFFFNIYFFLLSFTNTPAEPSYYPPIPFLYWFSLPSTRGSHHLSFLPLQPSSACSPSSLPLFPLREQWECFSRVPSVAPRFSIATAQNWLEILAVLVQGWNFKEGVLANLASSTAPPAPGPPRHWLTLV